MPVAGTNKFVKNSIGISMKLSKIRSNAVWSETKAYRDAMHTPCDQIIGKKPF
jgi:hypothetical protein